ncbi:MAG: hypothetical protein OEW19_11695, partial [Acidobacteriota bacterium]|nr:hypothetical protein [Acidobacteriota bacterium]
GFDAGRGRPAEADAGFERARLAAPQREDIDRIVEERARVQAPRVSVEAEQRTISDGWDERSERVSIGGQPWAHAPASLLVERRRVSAPLVRLADGRAGALDAVLSRLEASAAARLGAGTTLSGVVFGTSGGVGAGVRLSHEDLGGRSELTAEVNRPFWDFLELAAADGRRDRIGLQRQWRLRADTAAWALGGWNRYRVASGDEVQSAGLTLGIVHTVRRAAPTITLQYGLDKEHRLRASAAAGTDGTRFVPIPLVSREVHLVGAISRFALADLWDVEVAGGYTIDRLGGRGSFASVRLTPPPAARAGLEFWADRQLYSVATSQRVFRAGARLTVRF